MSYIQPKYPRVQVSAKRHKALSLEAKKLNLPIRVVLEQKLSKTVQSDCFVPLPTVNPFGKDDDVIV